MMNALYHNLPVPSVSELRSDPTVSTWLKRALIESQSRDPLDALRDAEMLVNVLRDEFDRVVKL